MRTRLVALPLLHYSQESMEHYQTASSFMIPTEIKKYKTRVTTTETIFSNTSKFFRGEQKKVTHSYERGVSTVEIEPPLQIPLQMAFVGAAQPPLPA